MIIILIESCYTLQNFSPVFQLSSNNPFLSLRRISSTVPCEKDILSNRALFALSNTICKKNHAQLIEFKKVYLCRTCSFLYKIIPKNPFVRNPIRKCRYFNLLTIKGDNPFVETESNKKRANILLLSKTKGRPTVMMSK